MEYADLHLHSNASDGYLAPAVLVERVRKAGISICALTDHDTIAGLDEAMDAGERFGVRVITGVEMSVTIQDLDVHILAYLFDHTNRRLRDFLSYVQSERLERARKIVKRLNEMEIPLTLEDVLQRAGNGTVGRPHIASALVHGKHVDRYFDAFDRFIGNNGPAYEIKYRIEPKLMFELVQEAGGVCVLAHPGKYYKELPLDRVLATGFDGIEVTHPSHSPADERMMRDFASRFFLLETGGSDYHGGSKGDDVNLGRYKVPRQSVESLFKRLNRTFQ